MFPEPLLSSLGSTPVERTNKNEFYAYTLIRTYKSVIKIIRMQISINTFNLFSWILRSWQVLCSLQSIQEKYFIRKFFFISPVTTFLQTRKVLSRPIKQVFNLKPLYCPSWLLYSPLWVLKFHLNACINKKDFFLHGCLEFKVSSSACLCCNSLSLVDIADNESSRLLSSLLNI